jgi:hypothetical protein
MFAQHSLIHSLSPSVTSGIGKPDASLPTLRATLAMHIPVLTYGIIAMSLSEGTVILMPSPTSESSTGSTKKASIGFWKICLIGIPCVALRDAGTRTIPDGARLSSAIIFVTSDIIANCTFCFARTCRSRTTQEPRGCQSSESLGISLGLCGSGKER